MQTNVKSSVRNETNLLSSFALKLGLDLKAICPAIFIFVIAVEQLGATGFFFRLWKTIKKLTTGCDNKQQLVLIVLNICLFFRCEGLRIFRFRF